MKICRVCNIEKPITDFYKRENGHRNDCKKCRLESESKRYKDNPELKRTYDIKKLYNLSMEKYKLLLEKQNNKCAICKIEPDYTLCVDHCHSSLKVRGLLCKECNIGLGKFKDNVSFLKIDIKYLGKNV